MMLHKLFGWVSVVSILCVNAQSSESSLSLSVGKTSRRPEQKNGSPYAYENVHRFSLQSHFVAICKQFLKSSNTQLLDEVYEDLIKLVKIKTPEADGRVMSLIEDYGELFGQDALLSGLGLLYDDIEESLCEEGRQCVTIGGDRGSLSFAKPSVVWESMVKRLEGMDPSEVEAMFNTGNVNSFS